MEILKNKELLMRLDEIRELFKKNEKNMDFLGTAAEQIEKIEDWKYSTGPIFNKPPYGLEMSGFSGGRLLKKQYPSPYEARLKGAYSSGFVKGEHRITVYPGKPANMPLHVARFRDDNDIIYTDSIYYSNHRDVISDKSPRLTSMSVFYRFDNDILAHVGVGLRNAYTIAIYYCDENNKIKSASTVTAPFNLQTEYEMHYDEDNSLISITSGGIVWKKGQLRAMD